HRRRALALSFPYTTLFRSDDLDLVAQTVGERRAQRAVDEAAGQDRVRGRTALPAEERAGDAARGVHALLDVHREGEEVEVLLGLDRKSTRLNSSHVKTAYA